MFLSLEDTPRAGLGGASGTLGRWLLGFVGAVFRGFGGNQSDLRQCMGTVVHCKLYRGDYDNGGWMVLKVS